MVNKNKYLFFIEMKFLEFIFNNDVIFNDQKKVIAIINYYILPYIFRRSILDS